MNKHINRYCSLAIFNPQVPVGALVLSSFIDSGVGDPQGCAEESRPTAVADGEPRACWGGCPSQVLSTSAGGGQ